MKLKWIPYGNRFSVAGVQYSDYQRVENKLKLGAQVRFIGERNNPFDRYAIRIEYDGTRIGYVPKSSAVQQGLWKEYAAKSIIIGVVTAVNKTNPTWAMITVQILVKRTMAKRLSKEEGEVQFSKMRSELSYMNRSQDRAFEYEQDDCR